MNTKKCPNNTILSIITASFQLHNLSFSRNFSTLKRNREKEKRNFFYLSSLHGKLKKHLKGISFSSSTLCFSFSLVNFFLSRNVLLFISCLAGAINISAVCKSHLRCILLIKEDARPKGYGCLSGLMAFPLQQIASLENLKRFF